jgi:hypothetical protein
MLSNMAGESETATVTRRTVVTDASGTLWDLGNPNFVAIGSASAGAQTTVIFSNGGTQNITVSFATASAAFNAS